MWIIIEKVESSQSWPAIQYDSNKILYCPETHVFDAATSK